MTRNGKSKTGYTSDRREIFLTGVSISIPGTVVFEIERSSFSCGLL